MKHTPTKLHIMNTPDTTQTAGQTAHSPLPWKLEKWGDELGRGLIEPSTGIDFHPIYGGSGSGRYHDNIICSKEQAQANAAFIVLAANNHDKLVAALKGMFAVHDDNTGLSGAEQSAILQSARTLLASLQS